MLSIYLFTGTLAAVALPRMPPYAVPDSAVPAQDRFAAALRAAGGRAPDLSGLRLLLAPSLLSEPFLKDGPFGRLDYFGAVLDWAAARGAVTQVAPVDTEASVAVNAPAVAAAIRASPQPVCVLSHSRGGIDTLQALLDLTPAEQARVACWIAVQAPFQGTPIADYLAADPDRNAMTGAVLRWLDGDASLTAELSSTVRQPALTARDDAIAALTRRVPVLAVATRMHPPGAPWRVSILEPLRQIFAVNGVDSDGVVPTASAVLPHARYVILDGIDHRDFAFADYGGWNHAQPAPDLPRMMAALIAVVGPQTP